MAHNQWEMKMKIRDIGLDDATETQKSQLKLSTKRLIATINNIDEAKVTVQLKSGSIEVIAEVDMEDDPEQPQMPTVETMRRITRNILQRDVEVTEAQTQRQDDAWIGEPESPRGSAAASPAQFVLRKRLSAATRLISSNPICMQVCKHIKAWGGGARVRETINGNTGIMSGEERRCRYAPLFRFFLGSVGFFVCGAPMA